MKNALPTRHPFVLPEADEAARLEGILARTTESRLASGMSPIASPFTVPAGFWEQQYGAILERKASRQWAETRVSRALRPAYACSLCLLMLAGFYLQPSTRTTGYDASVMSTEIISNTNSSDAQLLLEEELSHTTNTPTLIDDEEDEVLF